MEKEIESYFDKLFPICRSITGDGVRKTLQILKDIIPLELHEIPSGVKAFDWEIPKEWNIRKAYLRELGGDLVCDFDDNNLHVVSYSIPVKAVLTYEELCKKLHYLEELPSAIPYVTSYYKEDWGFCISYESFLKLDKNKKYEVHIESDLSEGHMTYGDLLLKGESEREVLFTTYICHPSMANNELSGVLVTAFLYKLLSQIPNRKYSYRFVFVPETVGSVFYLSQHGQHFMKNLVAGLVLTCIGDSGAFSFKHSRQGNSAVDKSMKHLLKHELVEYNLFDFTPIGSDERQYCSPGFNLPVGVLCRTMYHAYKEYHTSLDNKAFMDFKGMVVTLNLLVRFTKVLELNEKYINTNPFCEPQLGKRGLYQSIGGVRQPPVAIKRFMNILNYSDGKYDLIDVAEKLGESILLLEDSVEQLKECNLLK